MMKKLVIASLLGLVALVGLVAAYPPALAGTGAERSDCPGQIECPLTGELVCRDKCPATVATAAKPADTTALASEEEAELPPCCRNTE